MNFKYLKMYGLPVIFDISTMRLEYLENDFSPEQTWC